MIGCRECAQLTAGFCAEHQPEYVRYGWSKNLADESQEVQLLRAILGELMAIHELLLRRPAAPEEPTR